MENAREITRHEIFDYYSRSDIAAALVRNAAGREVAGAFFDGNYDSRPNVLQFPSDVMQMARKGVTSFHYSVEHWQNPMAIATGNYNSLRTGWDIIFDLDSKIGMDGSRIRAEVLHDFLNKKYGIKNVGIKFSGSRGFHLCLPWKMFPHDDEVVRRYPEIPRIIIDFIKNQTTEESMRRLIKEKTAKELNKIEQSLNPDDFVSIKHSFEDAAQEKKLLEEHEKFVSGQVEVEKWGARHMFRAPYSFNEKTWLVSVPISLLQMKNFSLEIAKPENVEVKEAFFKGEENEAESLLIDAMDWAARQKKEEPKKQKKKIDYERKIQEGMFPPCMCVILDGLQDGRKRALFTLISFLRMCNWPWNEIEQSIFEWNDKNKPPLARNIIVAQLRWGQANARNPWNCPPDGQLYVDIGVCRPDRICKAGTEHIVIKNPIVYPFKKMKPSQKENKINRGYSCMHCKKECKSMQGLAAHKSRSHGIVE